MNKTIQSDAVYDDGGWFKNLCRRLKIPGPTTITPEELSDYELEHVNGGIGYMMVQDIDAEYCRIAMSGPGSITTVVMAAKSRLSVAMRVDPVTKERFRSKLNPTEKDKIKQFNEAMQEGRICVVEQRVIDNTPKAKQPALARR